MANNRPTAAFVLGVFAATLAAAAIIPVTLPLFYRLYRAEGIANRSNAYVQTAKIHHSLLQNDPFNPSSVPYIRAVTSDGTVVAYHNSLPEFHIDVDQVCESVVPRTITIIDTTWSVACVDSPSLRTVAFWPNPSPNTFTIGLYVIALASIAGLVNALGIIRLLQPLTQIQTGLEAVSQGQKGIGVKYTGFREIDTLIAHVNATARAVENREQSILSRIQVVQELARIVAHEVRNPLQSLELLTSLIAAEPDPTSRRDLAQNIHAEIRLLDDVVSRLLRDGATRGALHLNPHKLNLSSILKQLAAIRGPTAEMNNIKLVFEVEGAGEALIDRALFARALDNLIANAIRAVASDTGFIKVDTSTSTDDEFVVTVEDNGPGVAAELGDRIFEANVTDGGGSGLGLALTKGVIEAHRGTIRFDRSLLGGALFEVRVPRALANAL